MGMGTGMGSLEYPGSPTTPGLGVPPNTVHIYIEAVLESELIEDFR
jgi:hypothetical protein